MLGDRISELRSMRSWSQVTLAKRLGVTKQAVSNWENGNIQPSIEMLLRLARLFGVPTDYLLGLENTETELSDAEAPQPVTASAAADSAAADTIHLFFIFSISSCIV